MEGTVVKIRSIFLASLTGALGLTSLAYGGTWQQEGSRYIYVENGVRVSNAWVHDTDEKWYYLNADGYMQTGWFRDGNQKWYYLNESGGIQTGWWKDTDGKWYYFGEDGAMYVNRDTPDGYRVGVDGVYVDSYAKAETQASAGGYFDWDAAQEVYTLVNKERLKRGLGILRVNAELQKAAGIRATEIIQSFAHIRPNGEKAFTAIDKSGGLWYSWVAENIAYGQDNPGGVMYAWMQSEAHNRNIVHPEANYMGAACYVKDGVKYWTQMFAHIE